MRLKYKRLIIETLGWLGMFEILLAYTLNALEIINVGFFYLLLNATGALFLSFISLQKKAWQPFALNIVWTFIGLLAILRLFW